jgi:hypothetical protein
MSESDQGFNVLKVLARHNVSSKESPTVYEALTECKMVYEELGRVGEDPVYFLRSGFYKRFCSAVKRHDFP